MCHQQVPFPSPPKMWPTAGLSLRFYPLALAGVTLVPLLVLLAHVPPVELGYRMLEPAPLQVVTYMAAHSDVAHLSTNLVSQLALGAFVECLHGHGRFLLVYVGAGVGGALAYRGWWCACEAPRNVYLVGASGAVYGLMGAYAAHLLLNWAELRLRALWLGVVLLTLALDVVAYVASPQPGVAYAAHVGGGVTGLCLGVLALRNVAVLRWERALYVAAAAALVGGALAVPLLCTGV